MFISSYIFEVFTIACILAQHATVQIFCNKVFGRFNSNKKYDDMQQRAIIQEGNTPIHTGIGNLM